MTRIAIIGAGATGLAAARALTAAGHAVTLFDKGRRPGGRMASREGPAGGFDHGVQLIRASAAEAAALGDGLLQPWPALADAWLAVPTMNRLAAHWAAGLDCRCSRTVQRIERRADGWRVQLAEAPQPHDCDALLLTVPTPQALPLLAAAGVAAGPLAQVRYTPNWTLMWTPAEPLPADFTHHAGAADDPLAWIAREDAKPGRDGPPRLTVQASAAWSTAHLEIEADDAARQLAALAAARLGIGAGTRAATAHRWRYAFVAEPLGIAVLPLAERLWYASDAGLGSRVGRAVAAGQAAAAAIAAGL